MNINNPIASSLLILSCSVTLLHADPLPVGTVLSVGSGNAQPSSNIDPCTEGSCFGMQVSEGFWIWTNLEPGNDGGIVTGKNQLSGGQELAPSNTNETPGDITAAWRLLDAAGTFFSDNDLNVFSDTSNDGMTGLNDFVMAWNGIALQLSGGSLNDYTISLDGMGGGSYSLDYTVVMPAGPFEGTDFWLMLRGEVTMPPANNNLPSGTLLGIEPGANPDATYQCQTGACYGLQVAPGFWVWTNVAPGTDGGIVVGKEQASGGQELAPSSTNTTSGEMTDAFPLYANFGTLSSLPGGADNIYHPVSCMGLACEGKTEIQTLYSAWNANLMILGGGTVDVWEITPDGSGGGSYVLDYTTVISEGGFAGVAARVIARGNVVFPPGNNAPIANEVSVSGVTGSVFDWVPDFTDPDASDLHVCEIALNASNGNAAVAADCSGGTYTPGDGYEGLDSFSYRVTDKGALSATAGVNVYVAPVTGTCTDLYRLKQLTSNGGGQGQSVNSSMTTTFTGHITTEAGLVSGGKNVAKICPGTILEFITSSTVGEVTCSINGVVSSTSGRLTIGDKLICSNKPDGSDVDRFSIKNGL